ncbi:MAG: hypothetical protein KA758_14920 [Acidimicrobiales bacterium]|nr:hypothetical protein [Acidimicrobiales bacterium]
MVRTPRFVARVLAAGALVAGLTLVGGPPAGAQAPTVTVTPATGLTDWTYVRVTGSGFEPNALLEYFQCRGGAVDENDCDGYNADYVDADGAGDVDFVVPVDARIWLPDGTEVDCRTDPAGCEIGVGYMLDAGEWPEAALEFDPDAPLRPEVTATVTPATGLVDGQTVAVHIEHVLPRFETWVFQCAGGAGAAGSATGVRWGRMCHLDNEVRGVADLETETLDLTIDVHERFVTPFGDQIDCNLELEGCEILVAWGFSDQPDRRAVVPIAFAAEPPPTTTSPTTAPPTTRPTAPTPPARPAPPVTGRPAYTD